MPVSRYQAEAKRADELAGDCARLMSEVAAVNDKWSASRQAQQQQHQQLQQQAAQQQQLQQYADSMANANARVAAEAASAPVHLSLVSHLSGSSENNK